MSATISERVIFVTPDFNDVSLRADIANELAIGG